MELDITNFLIKYPNIDQFDEDILNPYEEDFYESVYKKKEFYDIRLEEVEKVPDEAGFLMNHQKLISRFFSSNTLYDELLLLHEMGSGKTCTAIGAVEQIRKEGKFQGALYLAKGDALVNNFINELVFKCTDGRYIPEGYKDLTDLQKVHRTRKAIEDYYRTNTFETFANKIKIHKTDKALSKWCEDEKFNNSVIIIDEVHNLRMKAQVEEKNGDKTNLNIYNEFYRFLHAVKDCKILLMSGTPMKDGVEEIASVMNLILPPDKQLPTGVDFVTQYFDKKDDTFLVKASYVDTLKNAFKGRVSYLKSMRSTVEKVFQDNGDATAKLKHMIVYEDNMSDFQSERYENAYTDDGEENKGVWANSRQASLFVFPDGSIGKEGFAKYVKRKSIDSIVVKQEETKKTKYEFSLSESLKSKIVDKDHKEALKKLSVFSSKYAASITTILDAQKEGKSVFVYNEFVTGSGLILFGLILELFGFSKASGLEEKNSKKARYATLTSQTSTDKQIGMLVNRFNKPDNMTGKIINVIIGSRKISEGFTFKNVQIIDIHTPWFNYSETSQVIARGHRLGSHKDLVEQGLDPQVAIYQRVSIPNNKVMSIDFIMYKTSEDKDVSIKSIERVMKESAWDCSLSYKRNFVTGLDGKRECDYMDCNYVCDGVLDQTPRDLDYSSFYTQYDEPNIKIIIDDIIDLFRNNFKIDFDTLTNVHFQDFSNFEVLSALRVIINESRPIINKYGFVSYLKENNNIFFLSDSLSTSSTEYYTEYHHTKPQTSFDEVIEVLYLESVPDIIKLIKKSKNLEDVRKIMIRLTDKIQEQFIESSIQKIHIGPDDPDNNEIKICNLILKYFKNSWFKLDDVIISKHLDDTLRCFDSKDGVWKDCEDEYYDVADKLKIERKTFLENSPYGYYGLYNKTNNLFCLRHVPPKTGEVVKGHKQTSGKVCSTSYDNSVLVHLAMNVFKLPFPKPEDIRKIQAVMHDKVPDRYRASIMRKMINKSLEFLGKNREDLMSDIKSSEKIKKYLPTIKIPEDATDDELRRILFWCNLTKNDMCSYMHFWLNEIQYCDEDDQTCGASDKLKPK
jgi:hypothetical protein